MPALLNIKNSGFWKNIENIAAVNITSDSKIENAAREIIEKVKKDGDKALNELTRKFDNANHKDGSFKVTEKEIEAAYKKCDGKSLKALKTAVKRVTDYHKKQKPKSVDYVDGTGIRLGWLWYPVEAVGLYVPGGTAFYPSSVIMNAIPAKVAGVKRIVITTPAIDGVVNPLVLTAAKLCGISEIYKIGGAQAIAALSYGTKSIKPVDKIVGPGNAYVAAAKRLVFGKVGIDMIAGPSEILIIADKNNNPDWLAADLLSQAEHDKEARVFLISDNDELIKKTIASAEKFLKILARREIARESFENNSYFIKVSNFDEAAKVANIIAPEHTELCFKNAEKYLPKITNSGAIFLGKYTPEPVGDYMAGPSHVLPTSSTARFSSGLSVYDFVKKTSLIGCTEKSFMKIADDTEILANEEGLTAHALSISIRKNGK